MNLSIWSTTGTFVKLPSPKIFLIGAPLILGLQDFDLDLLLSITFFICVTFFIKGATVKWRFLQFCARKH